MTTETETVVGTILVGAEGVGETEGETWLREATPEEEAEFWARWEAHARSEGRTLNRGNCMVDGNNRPYWLMSVLDTAPEIAREKATTYARTLRLTD